jgi:hypothetical protein
VRLASKKGFGQKEINRIQRLVEENQRLLIRRWNEHFNL